MKELLDKLKKMVQALETEKKSKFLICAIFLPDESFGKWDLILSASWLNSAQLESYKLIDDKLKECLTESESLQISRMVILDPEDPTVKFLTTLEAVKTGGYEELRPEELTDKFKFVIKRAYLLRS